MMSDRLLKESDVLKAVDKRIEELSQDPVFIRKNGIIDVMGVKKHILAIPSVERPQGEWITYYPPMSDMQKSMCGIKEKGYVPDKRFGRSKCSLCGCGRPMYEDNYCPNCGARMKGAEDE